MNNQELFGKTMYVVFAMKTEIECGAFYGQREINSYNIPAVFAEGMIGFLPVFNNYDDAKAYAGDNCNIKTITLDCKNET